MNIFSTATLVEIVSNLFSANTFFLDTFFNGVYYSQDEYVAIDIDVGIRRMSPFVSPLQEAKLVESRLIKTDVFKPPYIKDKRAPDLKRPVYRMLGEKISGELTAQERFDANIGWELNDQIDNLKRRQEWMATQSILNGYLTIKGDGFPEKMIDFKRDPSLNIVLSGSSMWDADDSKANPTNDIREWVINVLKLSGSQVTDLVFTNASYNALLKDKMIQQFLMNSSIQMSNDVKLTMGPAAGAGAMAMGYWGTYRVWLYNEWYVDENGRQRSMLPDGVVIGLSQQIEGKLAYGAIMDPVVGYRPIPYAPSMWTLNDPAQMFLMMQSSPLTIIGRPNASFVARVAKGNDYNG